jgi:hypothetical protein
MKVKHLDHDHRLYIMLVAVAVVINLLNGGMAILTEPTSWSHKVANTTAFGGTIGWAFLVAASCMLPLVFFLASDKCSRKIFKVATFGAGLGALVSIGLSYISRNMDLGWFAVYYLASGVFCLVVAGALSVVLNTSLARLRYLSLITRS